MYLRVNKHTDPNKSTLAIAGMVLAKLKKSRVETFMNLRERIEASQPGTGILIAPALNILFLLGLIEYRPKTDSFEYVGP